MFSLLSGFCFTAWQVFGLVCACIAVVVSFLSVVVLLGTYVRGRKGVKKFCFLLVIVKGV